jgi:hypothetical protein
MKLQMLHMQDPCIRQLHGETVGSAALLRHQDSLLSLPFTEYNYKGLVHTFGLQGLGQSIGVCTDFIW